MVDVPDVVFDSFADDLFLHEFRRCENENGLVPDIAGKPTTAYKAPNKKRCERFLLKSLRNVINIEYMLWNGVGAHSFRVEM